MQLLVTRVLKAGVMVKGEVVAAIEKGLVVFVGIEKTDTDNEVYELAEKVSHLRIFEDEKHKLNLSVLEKKFAVMCVPNFTLCANFEHGRRPSFDNSMEKTLANKYFENFVLVLESKGIVVARGIFGAHMEIDLKLDGPVNLILESHNVTKSQGPK